VEWRVLLLFVSDNKERRRGRSRMWRKASARCSENRLVPWHEDVTGGPPAGKYPI